MKELNEIVFEKRLLASIKGKFCLTKGHLGYQEGYVEVKYPPHRKLFLALLIQIRKKFFLKRALFNEASDPWMLYLSKIGPGHSVVFLC